MDQSSPPAWRLPALIGGGAALAAAAFGAILLGGAGEAEGGPQARGAAVQIALFQPAEPDIQPGEVMEVGPVVDGYEHRPPAPAEPYLETAWLEEPPPYDPDLVAPPLAGEVARAVVHTVDAPRAPEGRPWAFGLDQPRPDYAEARRRRYVEMERRLAERRAEDQARVYSSGPRPYADYRPADAFY